MGKRSAYIAARNRNAADDNILQIKLDVANQAIENLQDLLDEANRKASSLEDKIRSLEARPQKTKSFNVKKAQVDKVIEE